MATEFGALQLQMSELVDGLDKEWMHKILLEVGIESQGDFLLAAAAALGPDRKFSGWPRLGSLETDMKVFGTLLTITPVPYGGWIVADKGRRPGSVAPSRRSKRDPVILNTPWGPRTYSKATPLRIGSSPGKNALTHAKTLVRASAGRRVDLGVQKMIRGTQRLGSTRFTVAS
jgi:hypothetical protein